MPAPGGVGDVAAFHPDICVAIDASVAATGSVYYNRRYEQDTLYLLERTREGTR